MASVPCAVGCPEVDSIEELVQFPPCQFDGFVTRIVLGLEPLGLLALEPPTEAVSMPVQNFYLVARAIEEDKQHRVRTPPP